MNTGVIIVAGVGAVALTGIGWGIGVYNTLSIGRQDKCATPVCSMR